MARKSNNSGASILLAAVAVAILAIANAIQSAPYFFLVACVCGGIYYLFFSGNGTDEYVTRDNCFPNIQPNITFAFTVKEGVNNDDIPPEDLVTVQGSSGSYKVSVSRRTCTCKDFSDRRCQWSYDDPRRLCKHLCAEIHKNKLPADLMQFESDINMAVKIEKGFYHSPGTTEQISLETGSGTIEFEAEFPVAGNKTQWVKIRTKYDEYVYSYLDHRWGYKKIPFGEDGATAVTRWIHQKLGLSTDIYVGPQGGTYHLNKSGKKVYHKKETWG